MGCTINQSDKERVMAKRLCALVLLVLGMQEVIGARAGRFSQESYEKGGSVSVENESGEKKTVIKVTKDLPAKGAVVKTVRVKKEKKQIEKKAKPVKVKKEKVKKEKAPKVQTPSKKEKSEKKSSAKKDSAVQEKRQEIDKMTAQAKLPVQEQKVKVYKEKRSDVRSRIKDKEEELSQARRDAKKNFKKKPQSDKKELHAARLAAREALSPSGAGVKESEEHIKRAEIFSGARSERVDALEKELKDLKVEHRSAHEGHKTARQEFNTLCDKAGVKCADKASDPMVAAHDQVIKELIDQKKSVTAPHEKKEIAEKIDAHKQARADHIKSTKKASGEKKIEKKAKPAKVKVEKVKIEKKAKPAKVKVEKVKVEKKKTVKTQVAKPIKAQEPKKARTGRAKKEKKSADSKNTPAQAQEKYQRPGRALRSNK